MYGGEENESLAESEIAQGPPIHSENRINIVTMRAEGQRGRRNIQQKTGEEGKRGRRHRKTGRLRNRSGNSSTKCPWQKQMTNQNDTLIKVS